MSKQFFKVTFTFFGNLLIFLLPSYYVQLYVYELLEKNIQVYQLQLAYGVNTMLIVVIFSILMLLRKKYDNQLGFLYMFGSFVKFVVFYVVFYPVFNADGEITKLEFSLFFVPYLISLVVETISLIKVINHNEN
jgi:hypothetical protein